MAKLTPKQAAFVSEYLKDLNATQAAIRAGYSKKTADKQGTQLLGKTSIAQAIQEAMKAREARTLVTQDRIVAELAKIAFTDASAVAEVVTEQVQNPFSEEHELMDVQSVKLKNTATLSADVRSTLSQIKQGKHGIEVSQYDKMRALELLGRHLGMFDKHEATEEDQHDDGFLDALKGDAGDVWQE